MSRRFSFESSSEPQPQQPQQPQQTSSSPSQIPSPPPRYQSPPVVPLLPDTTLGQSSKQQTLPTQDDELAITVDPPQPPPHRNLDLRGKSRDLSFNKASSGATINAERSGSKAAMAGMADIPMGVVDANSRENGPETFRHSPGYDPRNDYSTYDESPYRPDFRQDYSQTSLTPLNAAFMPGHATPSVHSSMSRSTNTSLQDPYSENVYYNRHSRMMQPEMDFDPNSIEDDGDLGLEYRSRSQKGSRMNLNQTPDRAGGAAGTAATGGIMGTLGGLVGRNANGGSDPHYDPVGPSNTGYNGPNDYDLSREKNQWLKEERVGRKRTALIVAILAGVVILGAVVGGIAGGLLSRGGGGGHDKSASTSTTSNGVSANSDSATNGDLNKDSTEIQKLLGNTNLHKVFPGIDYTPMNTQYPDCIHNPPSQNNVTRDLAVLSQLTNTIRLYGTDCNQTQMLLHSIDRLELNGTVKVWLGVWQDTNATTNARQLAQMYDILDEYGTASFLGVIIGNEVLYREDMTETELGDVITGVRTNLTNKGFTDLAIASSDLGDNWSSSPTLVTLVDYVMANIHPFFAGVNATAASSWTNTFFNTHDVNLKSNSSKAIIGETGWPSGGGTDCGTTAITDCPDAAVAGISEMNIFMNDFVCGALDNGTNFFWFEAFDEPWKESFNTDDEQWEDKWGMMDVNRNLKSGVVIPDCGGQEIGAAGL